MNKNSKIAFVMPWHISERGGGAEVQANFLAQELAERGFNVSYICQTIDSKRVNTLEQIGSIVVHFLKPSGRFQWLDQNKYITPLNKIQPNYVLQRLSSNVTYVLGKYCKKNQSKLIWFCTDNMNPIVNFHFSKFKERSSMKSLGILKYSVFALSNLIMDYYRNKGMREVSFAFTQNDYQQQKIKENFNLESVRMISGHPLPLKTISISDRFNEKKILWCGNLGVHKRPELFIELVKKMKDSGFIFVMVGGHSDKTYVDKLFSIPIDNLIITGKLSFEAALEHFDNASLLINTSTSEGFANTYIQSWLRGVPTLVFGANPNQIITNYNLGFNIGSLEEAEITINQLFSDYKTYEAMSTKVLNYAIKNHSVNVMTDNFLKALESLN